MFARLIFGPIALLTLYACQDTEIQDGRVGVGLAPGQAPAVSKQQEPSMQPQANDNGPGPVPQVATSIASSDSQAVAATAPVSPAPAMPAPAPAPMEEELPAAAISPVSVGGAFLQCLAVPLLSQANCLVVDALGKPAAFTIEKAFIISGSPATWAETTFRKDPSVPFRYIVDLPANKKSDIGIALVYDKEKAAIDWLLSGAMSTLNQLRDGGFEALVPNSTAEAEFLLNQDTPFWKTRITSSSNCADNIPMLEVQTRTVADMVLGFEGKNWTELDGKCTDSGNTAAGNIGLYQDLKLDPKRLYMVKFLSKRRATDGDLQRLKVQFAGKTIFEQETTSLAWVQTSIVATIPQANVRIDFEETGKANRAGTLLDAVQIIDLGAREQVLGN